MLIEDYGLIGDMRAAALVGRNGAVDWLCLPRFDSASCFSALLGDERHGRWLLAPAGEVRASSRRYRSGTLVLETEFEVAEGAARVIDFMPRRGQGPPRLMRIVEGLHGRVPMRMELSLRPDYASIEPWVESAADGVIATAGPDAFRLSTSLPLHVEDGTVTAEFTALEDARERLSLTWHLSYEEAPSVEDADSALARTEAWWREWSGRCTYEGAYRDEVLISLIALKAMTSETTGAVIAAPTTSLPTSAAYGIGTTAIAGCATPFLRWKRCWSRGTPTRRWLSVIFCCESAPATRQRSRSCTGSAASGG
jgi:GH15 family glucan-1,4-alpha-glucosidase